MEKENQVNRLSQVHLEIQLLHVCAGVFCLLQIYSYIAYIISVMSHEVVTTCSNYNSRNIYFVEVIHCVTLTATCKMNNDFAIYNTLYLACDES